MSTPAGAAALVAGAFQRAADGTLMFPPFPGLSLAYTMRPTFSTIVQTGADLSNTTIQLNPYPQWQYDLSFGHLSDDLAQGCIKAGPTNPLGYTALAQFLGLFCAVGGRRDTFMLRMSDFTKRASDSHVRGLLIGIGDGATTAFQLVRNVGGFLDIIENPIPKSLVVQVEPTGQAPSTETPTSVVDGLVTLSDAPPAGAKVFATFDWLHRMRFLADTEELDAFVYQLYTRGNLKVASEWNSALNL